MKENSTVQRLSKVLKSARDKDAGERFTESETEIPTSVTDPEAHSEGNASTENVDEIAFDELDGVHLKDYVIENEANGLVPEPLDDVDGPNADDRLKHEAMLLKDLKVCLIFVPFFKSLRVIVVIRSLACKAIFLPF